MIKAILALGAVVAGVQGLQWGRLPMPTQLRLAQVGHKLQMADAETGGATPGLIDQIDAVVETAAGHVKKSETLVTGLDKELNKTMDLVTTTVSKLTENEVQRISLIKDFNFNAISLNGILVDMTTGTQQINDVISMANRIKTNMASDIKKINDAIGVTNDWLVKMDNWVTFVTTETKQIDEAQANLVKWGDLAKENINTHNLATVRLAKEGDDLETQISDLNSALLATGAMIGYTPTTLTMAEATGGFGWLYTTWS
jgi:hypothetical protein